VRWSLCCRLAQKDPNTIYKKTVKNYHNAIYKKAQQIPYIRVCADTHFLHYRSTSIRSDKLTFNKGIINKIQNFFREFYYFSTWNLIWIRYSLQASIASTHRHVHVQIVVLGSFLHYFWLFFWGRLITPTLKTPTVITPTFINTPTMHPGLYHHILSNRNSKQL